MRIDIASPQDIGRLVRAVRNVERLRQDDAAGAIGVSDVFLWRVEKGAPGVRIDKLLQVLSGLGIRLHADVSDAAAKRYAELTAPPSAARTASRRKPSLDAR